MASSSGYTWTWSDQYQDYYYVTVEAGNYVYHWHKHMQEATATENRTFHQTEGNGFSQPRYAKASYFPEQESYSSSSYGQARTNYGTAQWPDNGASYTQASYEPGTAQPPDNSAPYMPVGVPSHERAGLHDFISGTPEKGWYEPLDSSYRMRTGSEAHQFFKIGKVFAMLHIEAASEQLARQGNNNITVVRYGERAYSQIRRFIIVEVRRGFVYACPISTYGGQGTLKYGCVPSEHSVVYFIATKPTLFCREELFKEPIAVRPADPSLKMDPASRLNYGKTYPIEMNVKVKDIGDVIPEDLSNLLAYYREVNVL